MALGRDCLIFTFPMLGTLAAIVLSIVAFIGSSPKASSLNSSVYFMRLDFSNISTGAIDGLPSSLDSSSSALSSAIDEVISVLGLPSFYDVGGTGYCQGTIYESKTTVGNCSTPMLPFWFDLKTILEDKIVSGVEVELPDKIKDYEKILHGTGVAMWICYIVGIVLCVIELIIGCFTFHSRLASVCAGFVGAGAAIALVLASALATGVYSTYKKYFNDNLSSFGVKATLGSSAYALTWIGAAASIWAACWWILTICCGSTRRSGYHQTREIHPVGEEKEPFIGYVPHYS